MPTLHLLGSGAALSDPHRTTTMLAFAQDASLIAVDCGGDLIQRLLAAGLPLERLRALVLTHEHPDHVAGFPLVMEKLWLAGRQEGLPVYGVTSALAQAKRSFESFDTSSWKGMPEILWREVALQEGAEVLAFDGWTITAAPGVHSVPVIGLRAETASGVVAYSCDTEPSPAIVRLARGADILVHEATGEGPGHSSALQAAEVAREARAARLLLVHLPPERDLGEAAMAKARTVFAATEKGEEGGCYVF